MEPISYWHDSLVPGDNLTLRPSLPGDTAVDIAIVGAGFTGLWSAYYLLTLDPSLRVVVLERDTAGFGASGRNGGWCVGAYSRPDMVMSREMHRSVDEVGRVVAEAKIDCGFHKGGAFYFSVDSAQDKRIKALHRKYEKGGLGEDWVILDDNAANELIHVPGLRTVLFTRHAARVHPARLARGLAVEVERLGGTVYEGTAVQAIEQGRVVTDHGTVTAGVVVQGTEAYACTIKGQTRAMVPLANTVIATDPIDESTWKEIGLANNELFELSRLMLGYGQRTADNRIVYGGLNATYGFANKIPASPSHIPKTADRLRQNLEDLFPPLKGIGVSHKWSGVLGVPRDLQPGIGFDKKTGYAWGGGYTGQGVASANAAGRGLADLITGRDTELTKLPWVGHKSRNWEPEPLRWLGINSVRMAAKAADAVANRQA